MAEQIKAITIQQPWAWAIMAGLKPYEWRSWSSDYVGPLVIHAAKSDGWMIKGMNFLRERGITPLRAELEFGAVLGVVDMVDCKRPSAIKDPLPLPAAFGRFTHGFELANPRRLSQPVPMQGKLGLWSIDAAIVAELLGGSVLDQAHPTETKEQRLDRVVETVGRDRIHRIEQGNLW